MNQRDCLSGKFTTRLFKKVILTSILEPSIKGWSARGAYHPPGLGCSLNKEKLRHTGLTDHDQADSPETYLLLKKFVSRPDIPINSNSTNEYEQEYFSYSFPMLLSALHHLI